jgi:hypothetical protein
LVIPASVVIILIGCLLYVRGKKCTYNTLLGFGSFILHASIELIFGFPVSFPGEWDGAGAIVKRALRMHQIQHPEEELTNAEQCVEFLQSRFTSRALSSYEQSTASGGNFGTSRWMMWTEATIGRVERYLVLENFIQCWGFLNLILHF